MKIATYGPCTTKEKFEFIVRRQRPILTTSILLVLQRSIEISMLQKLLIRFAESPTDYFSYRYLDGAGGVSRGFSMHLASARLILDFPFLPANDGL